MTDTPLRYHIAIARPQERSLIDRLLRRRTALIMDNAPCEVCDAKVTGLTANYTDGGEYTDGYIVYKTPDSLDNITLHPCGHTVHHLVYAQQGYEHLIVRAVLGYERG